jgi:ATP-dependent Lon protease
MGSQAPALPGQRERIAILPLRNSVLFPMSVVPINVGRPRSVRLVERPQAVERLTAGVPEFADRIARLTDRSPEPSD